MTFNAFFRARMRESDNLYGIPWPDAPETIEGAVIVGHVGSSPHYIWHVVTQNPECFAEIQALQHYFASTYSELEGVPEGADVLLAEVEEDDPENPGQKRRRYVKMRDKPVSGVIRENVNPHVFAGVPCD